MTVESEVANLTTAVDNLTSSVNVKKATLDASVADSESAAAQALGYRDTASLHKLAAEAAATSATSTAAALTGFDLEAIAETKAVTAVDVFVYDTSKDSDGGAWRKRTQGTSWYNETLNTATRGSRREFPAVAVLVLQGSNLTIYDGDDPSLPMWMVFYGGAGNMIASNSASSVAAVNCRLVVGNALYDVICMDLLGDRAARSGTSTIFGPYLNVISKRNSNSGWLSNTPSFFTNGPIVSRTVKDVSMTVLPDAPIDPATGLPVPTIAVGTTYGTSVINDNGTVTDAGNVGGYNFVAFTEQGLFVGDDSIMEFATFEDIRAGDGWGDIVANTSGTSGVRLVGRIRTDFTNVGNDLASSGNTAPTGSQLINIDYNDPPKSMLAYTTSTYNTGWMPSLIKGVFLSATDDTDLVEPANFCSDPTCDSTSTFASPGLDWSYNADMADVNTTTAGKIHIKAGADGYIQNPIGTIPAGTGVSITFTISNSTVNYGVRVALRGGVVTNANRGDYFSDNGTYTVYFPPEVVTADCFIGFYRFSGHTGTLDIDDIIVLVADADRSANNNGLIVNGTVTRTPVATGAELVAYSGFSASNYLEQPYNSDLDFGTGDFCVMGWGKTTGTSSEILLLRGSTSYGLYLTAGQLAFHTGSGAALTDGKSYLGNWNLYTLVRRSGVAYIYVNGSQIHSAARANSVTSASSTVRLGLDNVDLRPATSTSLALWRISATAPTASQIAKMYNDENVLFQDNAQATLYGTSDVVTALAHDSDTNLLHVGTSNGRSVFDGLRRIDNTTDAVTTTISASGGFILEQ